MDDPPLPLDPSLAPVLLFDCGRGGVEPEEATEDDRLVYSIPKSKLLLARGFNSLMDNLSWITPQGWVMKLDSVTRDVSLRDPFSSRSVPLPPDRDGLLTSSEDTRCVMSTHRPTDPGCVVLVIHQQDPELCYCRPGEGRWFRYEYQPELMVDRFSNKVVDCMSNLTAVGGKFYTDICWEDMLAKLEFLPDPALSCSPVTDRPFPAGSTSVKSRMVESCGDLFVVQLYFTQIAPRIMRVEVKKLDCSNSTFVKVAGLGNNRVFFVCEGQFGASMAADVFGSKPNCIFFLRSDDKGLYTYDMEHGTTMLHNPGQCVLDFYATYTFDACNLNVSTTFLTKHAIDV